MVVLRASAQIEALPLAGHAGHQSVLGTKAKDGLKKGKLANKDAARDHSCGDGPFDGVPARQNSL